jgi:hypothetical protein
MHAMVLCAALYAAAALDGAPALIDNNTTHDGTVVTAVAAQLTMNDVHGKSRVFKVTAMARVSKNGLPAKLEDLKAGDAIRVTVDAQDAVVAISTIDNDKQLLAEGEILACAIPKR